ncbi:hypothetical protein CMO91_06205 [Candidatus Woesearchaeota archaeon]|nr:hypothetical protein [Candidatus Woesearchaeota archaeon]
MVFQKELKRLGLKDKEAAVYVACLELGPSPVQQISRKAQVVRATTYVVLEALLERGLVTQYKEGKKTLFSAEPPRQLLRLLEKQEETIAEKKHDLEQLLPELQVIMKGAGDARPFVRYFDGLEGLRAMRQEMVMYTQAGDTWYNFTPMDHLDAVFGRDELLYVDQRKAKGIKSKTIFTTKSDKLRKEILELAKPESAERRYITPEQFPSASGMTIYRNRIAIGSFTGKVGGVVVESDEISGMMQHLFELAWTAAAIESSETEKTT